MDKEKNKTLLAHPLLVGFFTCLCLLAILSLRASSKKAIVSKESIHNLEKTVTSLQENLDQTKQEVTDNQTEIAIEKIKRNELLLKKEGEIILQIPDEELSGGEQDIPENEKSGPWEEWKKLWKN